MPSPDPVTFFASKALQVNDDSPMKPSDVLPVVAALIAQEEDGEVGATSYLSRAAHDIACHTQLETVVRNVALKGEHQFTILMSSWSNAYSKLCLNIRNKQNAEGEWEAVCSRRDYPGRSMCAACGLHDRIAKHIDAEERKHNERVASAREEAGDRTLYPFGVVRPLQPWTFPDLHEDSQDSAEKTVPEEDGP